MATASAPTVFKNYINGEWVPARSGKAIEDRNPANTDELVGMFPASTTEDVNLAIDAAKGAYEKWRLTPAPKRAEILYRAAEITVATGHDYFVVVDQDVERDVTYRTYVNVPPGGYFYDPFFYRPYLYGPGFYDPAFGMYYDPYFGAYAPATTEQFDKYRAYATIAVYSGERPANEPKAYDARDVVKRLSATILRPPP